MQTVWCVQSITHAHTNVAMALHNVVGSHMTSDITDGHILNYQSLQIQTGWCKINNMYLELSIWNVQQIIQIQTSNSKRFRTQMAGNIALKPYRVRFPI